MILQVLVGLPLTDMRRGAGQMFEFGPQIERPNRRGELVGIADFILKFLQSWRISRRGVTILGSTDYRKKRRFHDRKTPPRDPDARMRWKSAKDWFAEVKAGERTVVEITVSEAFEPRLLFDDGTRLEGAH